MSKQIDKLNIGLSQIDKKILKILLTPNGHIKSTKSISAKLGIPLTTIRRRRKRLESKFLKLQYVLDIEKFGWRRVDFFISIRNGLVDGVANKLMELNDVTYVGKSIGEHTIDLRVETIVKDNSVLLDLLELIKGMEGVRDVVWSEIVNVVGKKISIPASIIDKI
ncbi:MAG: winged helix-turn-helix transcriptional regulator [Thermoproteota archaeon]|jgi:DNA-binding Lrp family transcriptional regulator|nr:winged helix-turn-helix transcriptional regulator [Thermoproteota archaeon]